MDSDAIKDNGVPNADLHEVAQHVRDRVAREKERRSNFNHVLFVALFLCTSLAVGGRCASSTTA